VKKRIAVSWSGGKDSCMTLDRLVKAGWQAVCLLTTVPVEIGRTFGHGEKAERIREQADALGIPVEFITCSLGSYTDDYIEALKRLKERYGLDAVAFGDLFLIEHREWGTSVAAAADVEAVYPLWMQEEGTADALLSFVESGYRAIVIRVKDGALSEAWLGREVDRSFYQDILGEDVCPMGEGGEYHTYVYDGPLFRRPVPFVAADVLQLVTTKRLEHHS
jgi:diphthine-ammonia ligase